MSRLKMRKRLNRVANARARLHADAAPATLFDRLSAPVCACPTWDHGGALAAVVEACPVHGPAYRAARLRGEALPRAKDVVWPKAPRPTTDPHHHAKLAALLAEATTTPARRFFTSPAGHRVELQPGQWYQPFRRMTDVQRRRLPLELPVLAPRCEGCGHWATWDMLASTARAA